MYSDVQCITWQPSYCFQSSYRAHWLSQKVRLIRNWLTESLACQKWHPLRDSELHPPLGHLMVLKIREWEWLMFITKRSIPLRALLHLRFHR